MSTMTNTSASSSFSVICIALYVMALISVPDACRPLSYFSPFLHKKTKKQQSLLRSNLSGSCPLRSKVHSDQSQSSQGQRNDQYLHVVRWSVHFIYSWYGAHPKAHIFHVALSRLSTVSSWQTSISVEKTKSSSSKKLYSSDCSS